MHWAAIKSCRRMFHWRSAILPCVLLLLAVLPTPEIHAQVVEGSSVPAPEDAEPGGGERDVSVFFLTNRRGDSGDPASGSFDGGRGQPQFGRCRVRFTPIPLLDQVGSTVPFYLPREIKNVSVAEAFDPDIFWDRLAAGAAETGSQSVVVFVHGYNYGFERTCRMAAEMQRSLDGDALVVMFSWPSNGIATDYVSDLADVEWSVPLLARFLDQLGDRIGPDGIQILAHSMGSRGTVAALERLGARRSERPVIGRLVLLAPDFDAQTFVERLPELSPLAGSMTLYASSNDTPLKLSRQLSGYPRLGEAGEFLTVVPGLETVDVSPAGIYQVFGHEYFFYHPLVAADLAELLSIGADAAERSGLVSRRRDGITHWEIRAEP